MSRLPAHIKKKADPKQSTELTSAELVASAILDAKTFFIAPGRKGHLIEDYMPGPGTVTAVISPPGGGKTTLLASLAFRFAFKGRYIQQDPNNHGESTFGDFLGQRLTLPPMPVLFIAREGHRQLQLLGAHQNELLAPASLASKKYYHPITILAEHMAPKLDKADDVRDLHTLLDAFAEVHGRAPGLIIMDTARKLLAGDENSSGDVTAFMQAASGIATKYACAVLVAHHTPKSETPTARGSGAWLADCDCEWFLAPATKKKKYVTVHVNKLKGFPLPEPIHFTITPVLTELHDLDNPGEFLSAAHITPYKPVKSEDEDEVGGPAADRLVSKLKGTPAAKHDERQQQRIKTMMAVWNETGEEYANELPYITRAALAEYLINTLGYTSKTAQQALKPSADVNNKGSIIGPLLTDGLIAAYEHGWTIGAPEPAYPSMGQAQKPQKKKPIPRKG